MLRIIRNLSVGIISIIIPQYVFATPSLQQDVGFVFKDDVAPMHHRSEGNRLFAPGDRGIGNVVYTTGEAKIIVLLVEFLDEKFDSSRDIAYFESLMREFTVFYKENSYGKFYANVYIVPEMYELTRTMAYYGNSDDTLKDGIIELVRDSVKAADNDVDFRNYDALIIIHAGQGQESNAPSECIHSQFIYRYEWIPGVGEKGIVKVDNVWIFGACIAPEHQGEGYSPLGVICHEFGHQLGLEDLYPSTGKGHKGVGRWSLMDYGAWNDNGYHPGHFDAWSKKELGWVEPIDVSGILRNAEIKNVEQYPIVYKLHNSLIGTDTEYFLVENRQPIGFDKYLPGHGLIIYHINEAMENNDDPKNYKVGIEQADGRKDFEYGRNNGDAGDPYPGSSNNRIFSDTTIPNSRTYSGTPTYITICNISDSGMIMNADLIEFSLTPVLISPENSTICRTTTPTFKWDIEYLGTYALFIFHDIYGTISYTINDTTYTLSVPLQEDEKYYWYVEATDGGNVTVTSDKWYFWINAENITPTPPENPIVYISLQPKFTWTASTDDDPSDRDKVMYQLQYAPVNNNWSDRIIHITTTSYTISENLQLGIVYKWRIRATDGISLSPWVEGGTFTVYNITVYPNPCIYDIHKNITFRYLPEESKVSIYNILGEKIITLSPDNSNTIIWNIKNYAGEYVASGIYFYVVEQNDIIKIRGTIGIIK